MNTSVVTEHLSPPDTLALAPLLTSTLTLWQVLSVLLIAGGALIIVLVLRRPPAPPARDAHDAPYAQNPRQTAEQLEQILAEARELLHLLGQRADAQADRLEHLIAQADQRLEHLEAHIQSRPEPPPSPSPEHPVEPRIDPRADALLEHKPEPAPPQRPRTDHPHAEPAAAQGLVARIYELADQRLPPAEIARRTGQHAGKVELILALRSVGPRPDR